MASIFEALQNAEINLITNVGSHVARVIGQEQLRNAVRLLGKGYSIHDDVEDLLTKHGSLKEVPDVE